MRITVLLVACLILCFTACGPKSIPYSQGTDAPKPSKAAKSHYNWGLTYAKQGNLEQAVTEFRLAIHYEPRWALPYFNLGATYANWDKLDQAIVAWEHAAHLDPDFAKAHYYLALVYSVKAGKVSQQSLPGSYIAKSIASLREAIRLDKAVFSAAEAEPVFEAIRNTPEYQAMRQAATQEQ